MRKRRSTAHPSPNPTPTTPVGGRFVHRAHPLDVLRPRTKLDKDNHQVAQTPAVTARVPFCGRSLAGSAISAARRSSTTRASEQTEKSLPQAKIQTWPRCRWTPSPTAGCEAFRPKPSCPMNAVTKGKCSRLPLWRHGQAICHPASVWPIRRQLPPPRRPAPHSHPLRVRHSTASFAWTSTMRSKRSTASQVPIRRRTTVFGGLFVPYAHGWMRCHRGRTGQRKPHCKARRYGSRY